MNRIFIHYLSLSKNFLNTYERMIIYLQYVTFGMISLVKIIRWMQHNILIDITAEF